MTQSLLCAGSYADSTINSNRSDDNTEHRNSVGREETLKSFDSKIPLQFKPSKVTEQPKWRFLITLKGVWVFVSIYLMNWNLLLLLRQPHCVPVCARCPAWTVSQDTPKAPPTAPVLSSPAANQSWEWHLVPQVGSLMSGLGYSVIYFQTLKTGSKVFPGVKTINIMCSSRLLLKVHGTLHVSLLFILNIFGTNVW